jgi:regulator of replication initiation timing
MPSLREARERRMRLAQLEGQMYALRARIRRLTQELVPIVTEVQALRFELATETARRRPLRETRADQHADDLQVWILQHPKKK